MKKIIFILTIILTLSGCDMTETTTVSIKDVDYKLTKDWVNICLGRYSFKIPPERITDKQKYRYYYDGYELKLSTHKSKELAKVAFDALVQATKSKIGTLPVPEGLRTAFHREDKDKKNQYLVAYRSAGQSSPELLEIEGFILIKDVILTIVGGNLDGYKNRFQGKTDKDGKVINWDEEFNKTYALAQRILRLAEPAKPRLWSGEVKPGLCVEGRVLIAGDPITEQFEEYSFGTGNFSVQFYYIEKILNRSPIYQKEKPGDEVYFLDTNGLHGSVHRRVNLTYIAHQWIYENSDHLKLEKPLIKIRFDEGIDEKYTHEKIDEIFKNIMAGFHLRQ